ncbi:MAG: hypothetical protein LBR54_02405 [Oscillospiraceae bacterium]|nr:hypothetical protein [Oscillospiraceae bacterium]
MSLLIIILLITLISAVGVLIYLQLKNNSNIANNAINANSDLIQRNTEDKPERPVLGGQGSVLTEENYEKVLEELNTPSPDKQYRVNMSSKFEFETWDTPSSTAFVRNREENSRTVCIDLYLTDEDGELTELVYSSPYIPLGETLRNFALDSEVPAGQHKVMVVFTLVDDDFNKVTTLSVGTTLLIEN